jgi:UDP-N-acetylglucosamine--N-acetylmuramyl-(pentapeptide) pyrophosphoryl-undecaprenol N-acetylglucosamine transferase
MKIILSGGGTGGHVYPAIAVADCLRKRRPQVDILFVGAKGKMEMEKVPQAGYPIEGLWISGLQRRLTLRNLSFPFKLVHSLWRAGSILRRFQPDMVMGFGGYASGPLLRQAVRKGIPALLQEQNSYAGITNRLLASKVKRICVAHGGMERFFPSEKIVVTGNPVRNDLLNLEDKRIEAIEMFRLDENKKTLLLFGGSLGARTINEAMRKAEPLLGERDDIQVLWQMGKLYAEQYAQSASAKLGNVKPLVYIDRMDLAYAAADVVVCRAGALTISELCIAAKPTVLVPSPNVAEDHQKKNALSLVEKNAALMVEDDKAGAELVPAALQLLEDKAKQLQLAENIRAMARPDAAERIVDVILEVYGG